MMSARWSIVVRYFFSGMRQSYERVFFFFQAEDGIRDHCVTGVQTCALPILPVFYLSLEVAYQARGDTGGQDLTLCHSGVDSFSSHAKTMPRHAPVGKVIDLGLKIGRASCRESVDLGSGRGIVL